MQEQKVIRNLSNANLEEIIGHLTNVQLWMSDYVKWEQNLKKLETVIAEQGSVSFLILLVEMSVKLEDQFNKEGGELSEAISKRIASCVEALLHNHADQLDCNLLRYLCLCFEKDDSDLFLFKEYSASSPKPILKEAITELLLKSGFDAGLVLEFKDGSKRKLIDYLFARKDYSIVNLLFPYYIQNQPQDQKNTWLSLVVDKYSRLVVRKKYPATFWLGKLSHLLLQYDADLKSPLRTSKFVWVEILRVTGYMVTDLSSENQPFDINLQLLDYALSCEDEDDFCDEILNLMNMITLYISPQSLEIFNRIIGNERKTLPFKETNLESFLYYLFEVLKYYLKTNDKKSQQLIDSLNNYDLSFAAFGVSVELLVVAIENNCNAVIDKVLAKNPDLFKQYTFSNEKLMKLALLSGHDNLFDLTLEGGVEGLKIINFIFSSYQSIYNGLNQSAIKSKINQLLLANNQGNIGDYGLEFIFNFIACGYVDELLILASQPQNLKMIELQLIQACILMTDPHEKLLEVVNVFVSSQIPMNLEYIDFIKAAADSSPNEITIKYLTNFTNIFPDVDRQMSSLLQRLDDEELIMCLNSIIEGREPAKRLTKLFSRLTEINIYDSGISFDSWWPLTADLIRRAPAPNQQKLLTQADLMPEQVLTDIRPSDIDDQKWKFLRLQGRTILLQDSENNILAIKVQKEAEKKAELIKEFQTETHFKNMKEEWEIKCYLPTTLGFSVLNNLDRWLITAPKEDSEKFYKFVGKNTDYFAYLYEVDRNYVGYFEYFHSLLIPLLTYKNGNRKILNTLIKLFCKQFVLNETADIFHNIEGQQTRSDQGRYIVLANLLSPAAVLSFPLKTSPPGSGRLSSWKTEAINYVNFRKEGNSDWGGWLPSRDLYFDSEFVKDKFNLAREYYQDKLGNYLLANFIAEYQYVLFLVAGRRGSHLSEVSEKKSESHKMQKIWQDLAELMLNNAAYVISMTTSLFEGNAIKILQSIVDIKRLARQMQFWMTTEYIKPVSGNYLPPDIYGEETKVNVDASRFRQGTFSEKVGFSINLGKGDDPDLGPVNGQEPIKEFNKLLYWTINLIYIYYHQTRLAHSEIQVIRHEKNPVKAEQITAKGFAYLSKQSDYFRAKFLGTFFCLKSNITSEKPDPAHCLDLLAKCKDYAKDYRENRSAEIITRAVKSWHQRKLLEKDVAEERQENKLN